MNTKALKYIAPLSMYALAIPAFTKTGIWCWLPLIYAWIVIPGLELVLKPSEKNMDASEEELIKKDAVYDWMLYLAVILLFPMLYLFLGHITKQDLSFFDIYARVFSMGLLCGTFGINVGHELGHRIKPGEQWLAKLSLSVSLYAHFFIEHNKGHHKNVATPEDPSSARLNEPVYLFYFRTVFGSLASAWHIAAGETKKKNKPVWSMYNELLQLFALEILLVILVFVKFGFIAVLYFFLSAMIGALLLETINYIEHYGLSRKIQQTGKYERAMPEHSWNSNHIVGRLMLFELSRHSDHHYLASRKYQILRNHEQAPQMPTGYPGMMLLSLVPPLWFYIMHKRLKEYGLMPTDESDKMVITSV